MIPEKSDQIAARRRRGSRGGRPPELNTAAYRGLATRCDKLAITHRAAIILAACLTWTRIWETWPSRGTRSAPARHGRDHAGGESIRPSDSCSEVA